jgi:hypothetical protein
VQRAIDAGAFEGQAVDLAMYLWGMNHGITSLAIAGMMGTPDEARARVRDAGRVVLDGLRTQAAPRGPGSHATATVSASPGS